MKKTMFTFFLAMFFTPLALYQNSKTQNALKLPVILSVEALEESHPIVLSPTPTPEPTKAYLTPTDEELLYMAQVIDGEARGCSLLQKSGVAWCVCNRVDCAEYPDNIIDVITQPYQFHGYKSYNTPIYEDFIIAWDVIFRWKNGLDGRTLPQRFLFFHSKNTGKNFFTTDHRAGEVWDWSLPNIYETEGIR